MNSLALAGLAQNYFCFSGKKYNKASFVPNSYHLSVLDTLTCLFDV